MTAYPYDDGRRSPVETASSETPEQQSDTARLEAFSDGVFAVAITLLVLNLRVPLPKDLENGDVFGFLKTQWPSYLAYVASFLAILVMWINHQRLLVQFQRTPWRAHGLYQA